jgi:O-antigen ligase
MVLTMALSLFCGLAFCGGVRADLLFPMAVVGFLSGAFWGVRLLLNGDLRWNLSQLQWPVIAFLGYSMLRCLFSPFQFDAQVELVQITLCAVGFLITANHLTNASARKVFLVALIAILLFESSYAIYQSMTKSIMVLGWEKPEAYRGRGSGTYICPNNTAALLEMGLGLVLAMAVLVHVRRDSLEKFVVQKLLVSYAALMAVAGIIVTYSRTGWMAALAALLMILLWVDRRKRAGRLMMGVALGGILMMAVAGWKFDPVRQYIVKTFSVKQQTGGRSIALEDASLGGRIYMWGGTLKMIQERPLLGYGLASWQWFYTRFKSPQIETHAEHTHNEFLNLAADYGLAGFGCMAALFWLFYRHALRISRNNTIPEERAFAIGAIISITAVLLHSMADFPFHIPANSLLLAMILGATAAIKPANDAEVCGLLGKPLRISLGVFLIAGCSFALWNAARLALAERYTEIGDRAKEALDHTGAVEYFRKAIAIAPVAQRPHAKIGDTFRTSAVWRMGPGKEIERKRLAESAVESYESAVILNPLKTEVLLRQAHAFELSGRSDRALTNYLRAIDASPYNAFNHMRLGFFYRDRGMTNEAKLAFQRSYELDVNHDATAIMNFNDIPSPK